MKYLFAHTDYERMLRVRYNSDTFNLSRMRSLLKRMGDPHKSLRCVHIAGTKGKGSTATMLAQMLKACGHKVGLYTSPHLTDIRERIRINGEMISQAALTRLINKASVHVERMDKAKPTFFEIFTALAFQCFADSGVDIVILETGLGGRLDSTNVVKPMVVGLTSISLDHTHQLGNTIEKIAAEKAGVLKSGVPAVSVPQVPAARTTLKRAARQAKAPLMFTGENIDFSYRFESSRDDGPQTRVCLTTDHSRFEHLPVPLMGEHQAVNCGLALALLDQLKTQGVDIDDRAAIAGLAKVDLPGRMELVRESPRILVDGAHNAASVEALMRAIGQYIPYDSMVVVFACAADKDIDGMLDQIIRGADKVIFTRYDSPRCARPEDLAEAYEERSGKMGQIAQDLPEALGIANNAVSREDIICITGSFYLVGEAKKLLGG
ncbi:MAG: bifunctional folylpolyglutamate synthase/dihydrofolate synthase [Planctomycetota bacterium]